MLFNSLSFLWFFPFVCIIYWLCPQRHRNLLLLIASYYFYMNWEPVYALLILFSTTATWTCGHLLARSTDHRKLYLTLCLVINFAILFIYKYLGFAATALQDLLALSGIRMEVPHFNLLLPVGISFYTFQAVGYTIDVYRGDITHEKNFLTYALFVSFFPQLVAGPIERARNLLPQFHERHTFNGTMFCDGLKDMAWGYFMKLCIAENVGPYVDAVFNNLPYHSRSSILLATFFFTFQIFCDFGGYSLIAIGTAKCLGFRLMQNFRQPYLASSVKDFWRRWHISLSSWLSDYVYIPLGGSRCPLARHCCNLMLTFLVSGIWHGADWTFVSWGILHGFYLVIDVLRRRWIPVKENAFTRITGILLTFLLVMTGWIFFRANTMQDAFMAIQRIFTADGLLYNGSGKPDILLSLMLIGVLMVREFKAEYGWMPNLLHSTRPTLSVASMSALLAVVLLCAEFSSGQFIYFQF